MPAKRGTADLNGPPDMSEVAANREPQHHHFCKRMNHVQPRLCWFVSLGLQQVRGPTRIAAPLLGKGAGEPTGPAGAGQLESSGAHLEGSTVDPGLMNP